MTILAWDGKHLAVDSRATYGPQPESTYTLDCHNKVYRVRNSKCTHKGAAIKWAAYCGSVMPMDLTATHVLEHVGEITDLAFWPQIMKPQGELLLLFVDGTLLRCYYKHVKRTYQLVLDVVKVEEGKVKLFGSGSDIKGLVEAFCVKDARDAALLAAQLSEFCGGEVQYVTADSDDVCTHLTIDDDQKAVMLKVVHELASGSLLKLV